MDILFCNPVTGQLTAYMTSDINVLSSGVLSVAPGTSGHAVAG